MKAILLGTALTFPLAAGAATLGITISGTLGSGVTTWVFDGATVAQADGTIGEAASSAGGLVPGSQFRDIAAFSEIDFRFFAPLAGAASVIVDPQGPGVQTVASIGQVLVDEDSDRGPFQDDFGFTIVDGDTRSTVSFQAGDKVSFFGALQVGIDIDDLSAGGLPYAARPQNGLGAALPLILSIDLAPPPPVVIPLPAGLPLMALGLGAVALIGRRRRG